MSTDVEHDASASPPDQIGLSPIRSTQYCDTSAVQSYGMAGSGGNKVFVLPELDAVVVITTTNFQVRDAHPLSEKLLTSLIMPVLMRP